MRKRVHVTVFLAALGFAASVANGADAKWALYGPTLSTLTGTITEEAYGEDTMPNDRGKRVWILHLSEPISLKAAPGREIDVQELNVSEVQLNIDHHRNPISEKDFGVTRFEATGTLYHGFNTHHRRPIEMLSFRMKPASEK